jgi:hypothetical protein
MGHGAYVQYADKSSLKSPRALPPLAHSRDGHRFASLAAHAVLAHGGASSTCGAALGSAALTSDQARTT